MKPQSSVTKAKRAKTMAATLASRPLTFLQSRFVAELPLVNYDAAAAYRNAGYKVSSASLSSCESHRLLSKPIIQAAIAAQRQAIAKRSELSQDWVIEKLKVNLARALQEEPVLDSRGNPTGVYQYDGSVANKALELLGKQIGMFIERKMVGRTNLDAPQELDEFSLEDLKAFVEHRRELRARARDSNKSQC